MSVTPRNSQEINEGMLRPLGRFNNENLRLVIVCASESLIFQANMETSRTWKMQEDPSYHLI